MNNEMNLAKFSGLKLKELRKSRGWTQGDLGKKIKVQPTAIGNYERGERPLNQDILFQLSDIFDVSIDYFFPVTVPKTEIQNIYDQLDKKRQNNVCVYAEQQLEEQNKVVDLHNHVEETMYGYLSAGTGEPLAEEIQEPIRIPKSILPQQHYDLVLKVNGDSMEPMFRDEEFVFVRKTEDIRSGQIGVFIIDGESYLKKVYINDDHIKLVSLNKDYEDLFFDDVSEIKVVGTVVM